MDMGWLFLVLLHRFVISTMFKQQEEIVPTRFLLLESIFHLVMVFNKINFLESMANGSMSLKVTLNS